MAYALGLFLEVGTFVAATVYFRSEVLKVLRALIGRGDAEGKLLLKYLIVVTAITAVIGVIIYKVVSETVTGPVLGAPMILLGLILIADGLVISFARGRRLPQKGLADLKLRDLIIIGIVQGIAALPGVSRSGVTVSAMLLLGIKPRESFRLSFLALIPASVGATLVTLVFSEVQISSAVTTITPPVLYLAIFVAILVGLLTINLLLRVAASSRITLLVFILGGIAILSGIVSLLTGTG